MFLPLARAGSITLFAVITVVLGCLKIGYFVGFSDCLSATEGVFPVTHAVHTLVQVHPSGSYAASVSRGVPDGTVRPREMMASDQGCFHMKRSAFASGRWGGNCPLGM